MLDGIDSVIIRRSSLSRVTKQGDEIDNRCWVRHGQLLFTSVVTSSKRMDR